jgi:hypothetical protein
LKLAISISLKKEDTIAIGFRPSTFRFEASAV